MRGKWAQGIEPRHFRWIVKDRVAVCERPGGYGDSHRKVRRQEEIIWLRQNEFDFVLSLIGSTHNLHNYEELGVPFHHVPFSGPADGPLGLTRAMASIRDHVDAGHKIVVHREELGERVAGLMAAYLLWMDLVPDGPRAIMVTEQLFERELGPIARELVAMVPKCTPSAELGPDAFAPEPEPEPEDEGDDSGDDDDESAADAAGEDDD
ncbi:MAG: hypothetical protein DHS20C19_12390 [Acidimicrobiales bacterium]|nr:MAG: hypothetical protein DHS20C19_12390 [Acidimicrobiales bacterium]